MRPSNPVTAPCAHRPVRRGATVVQVSPESLAPTVIGVAASRTVSTAKSTTTVFFTFCLPCICNQHKKRTQTSPQEIIHVFFQLLALQFGSVRMGAQIVYYGQVFCNGL